MKYFLCLFFISVATTSFAIGTFNSAKITKIRIDGNGTAMIFFDRDKVGTPPSCVHTAYSRALGVDTNTDGGKAVLSVALTVKATGGSMTAHGLGVCGVYGGTIVETWNHGFIL